MKQQTMQTLRCLIVDDESAAHKTMRYYISKVPGVEFSEGCMNGLKALDAITEHEFDIIFLDVDMPYISGIQFLEIAGKISASVILTTAHREFAIDGYKHEVADFLLKPFSLERFVQSVYRVRTLKAKQSGRPGIGSDVNAQCDPLYPFQIFKKNGGVHVWRPRRGPIPVFKEEMMWIRVNQRILPIDYKDLHMIKAEGNHIWVCVKEKKYLVRTSLTLLLERLPEVFIRTHKSYIVNRHLVETVSGNEIVMSGGMHVAKISRYLRSEVLNRLGPLYG